MLSSSGDDDDSEEEDVEEAKLPLVLNLLKLLLLKLLKLLLLLIIPLLLKKCRATKRLAERAADILFIMRKMIHFKEEKGLSFIHKIYLYRLL